jgi:aryl-alcohol dehydrogenase-like predicted oxidoreductase
LEYRKLRDLEVSAIGMGTLRTFDVTSEEDIAVRQEIVDSYITSQVNFIDTAAWYGNAEKVVGITTSGRRDKFYLGTKVRCEGQAAGETEIARSF